MQEAVFRQLYSADLESIAAVDTECFGVPWTYDELKNDLETNSTATYIGLCVYDKLIGFGTIWMVGDACIIPKLCIVDACRGNGYGTALLYSLMDAAKSLGANSISLEVREHNRIARHMYEAAGFTGAGVRVKYYEDTGENAHIMYRSI